MSVQPFRFTLPVAAIPCPGITELARRTRAGRDRTIGDPACHPMGPGLDAILEQLAKGGTQALSTLALVRLLRLLRRTDAPYEAPRLLEAADQLWQTLPVNAPVTSFAATAAITSPDGSPLKIALLRARVAADTSTLALAGQVARGSWGKVAKAVVDSRSTVRYFFRQHGVLLPEDIERDILDAALSQAGPSWDGWVAALMDPEKTTEPRARGDAASALVRHVPATRAREFPRTAEVVAKTFQAGSSDWNALEPTMREAIRGWLRGLTFRAVEQVIAAVQDRILELDPRVGQRSRHQGEEPVVRERNRLRGRTDFWSYYQHHIQRMRLIVSPRSRQVLSSLIAQLPPEDILVFGSGVATQSEVLMLDLGRCVVADELRGSGVNARIRITPKSDLFADWIAHPSPHAVFPVPIPSGAWALDHRAGWAEDLVQALLDYGIEPDPRDGKLILKSVQQRGNYSVALRRRPKK